MEPEWVEVKKKSVKFEPGAERFNSMRTPEVRGRGNYSRTGDRGGNYSRNFNQHTNEPKNYNRGRGRGGYKSRQQQLANIPDFKDSIEEEKFKALQKEIPHIMMPGKIRREQANLRIDKLAEKMLSDEWIDFQREGWKYLRVVKPDDDTSLIPLEDVELMDIENEYGDFVLFGKV
jgi:hypothetical protein